ncbi:MAG TPA: uracil phosphoribosyltransferase [Holophagaceae bacterium]|nr:uracil phosphoribosyltransferase [Holophagaceae bacterium]
MLSHPLVDHKLGLLRDRATPGILFRQLLEELGLLLAVEATRHLRTEPATIETPLERMEGRRLPKLDPVLVPVLRAGLGLLNPFLQVLPTAKVGYIGLRRDHDTLEPVSYYRNLPPSLGQRPVILLDPMLATGGSCSEAVRELQSEGAKDILLVSLLAAPEGISRLQREHPGLQMVVGAVDRQLNDKGYILPGLGDAGDRLYGTV